MSDKPKKVWVDESGKFVCNENELPKYSTDIAAAWLVVERMISKGYSFSIYIHAEDAMLPYWMATFKMENSQKGGSGGHSTAPGAISLAALRAIE